MRVICTFVPSLVGGRDARYGRLLCCWMKYAPRARAFLLHSGGRRSRSKTIRNALPERGHPSLFSGKKNQEPLKRCCKSSAESEQALLQRSTRLGRTTTSRTFARPIRLGAGHLRSSFPLPVYDDLNRRRNLPSRGDCDQKAAVGRHVVVAGLVGGRNRCLEQRNGRARLQ
jgi:hypothetical protein